MGDFLPMPPKEDKEDIRIGYQAAVSLLASEGSQTWSRFNVMLVANSIIVLGLSSSAKDDIILVLRAVLPYAGLLICLAWFLITNRGADYQRYYVMSARELERRLSPTVQTLERGHLVAGGSPVMLDIGDGKHEHFQMPLYSRVGAHRVSLMVIVAFFSVYIVVIAKNIWH